MMYSDFPFDTFLGVYNVDTPNSVKPHTHDYCEIEIMLNGSANHFFDESNYPLCPGDTFVINKGVTHALKDAHDLKFYNIGFNPDILAPFLGELKKLPGFQALFIMGNEADIAGKSRLRLLGKDLEYAESLCSEMLKEYFSAQEGFKCSIIAKFLSLVVHLSRFYSLEQDVFASNKDRISYVAAYIENHFTQDMTIDFLAEKANMSTRNFSRAFRSLHQTTPLDYILHIWLF